jgi:hypothetical protein
MPDARVAAGTEAALRLQAAVRHLSRDRIAAEAFVDRYLAAIGAGDGVGALHASATRLARRILRVACEPGLGLLDQVLEEAGDAR